MRWKISHRNHDPRHIDLIAALALVLVIAAVCRFLSSGSSPPNSATRSGSADLTEKVYRPLGRVSGWTEAVSGSCAATW